MIISHSGKIARGVRVPLDQLYNLKTLNVTAQMIDMALSNVLYELIDKSIPANPLGPWEGKKEVREHGFFAWCCLLDLLPARTHASPQGRRVETLGCRLRACPGPYGCGCIGTYADVSVSAGIVVSRFLRGYHSCGAAKRRFVSSDTSRSRNT